MRIMHTPVRRSLVAAVALGAGLTLAACGGGDDEETTTTEDSPQTSEEPEVTSGGAGDGAESGSDDGAESGSGSETGSDDPAGLPPETGSESGSAGPGGESGSAAAEERIDITWPEGWEDLETDSAGLPQGVAETHAYALDPAEPFPTGARVIRYAPGTIGEGTFMELFAQSGQDTSEFTELEPRDIGGHEAEGIETTQDLGDGEMRQRAYGFPLEDGSYVEISVQSPVDDFDSHEEDFEAILDSIEIS
ncbi:hypothetical protein ACPYO6_12320 [Georgenia sp. Z1344]|uniref:hypothetical protein n=1 Tax=Georgenia sp. Z1344 TaxID=3416706 RepID=UPI003CF13630